jgi:hypothetical protein
MLVNVKHSKKVIEHGVVGQACNPSTWVEAGGLLVGGQPVSKNKINKNIEHCSTILHLF